jgi:hypothetical protein
MMKWGLAVTKDMNLPVFVESTLDGEEFYKAHGFTTIEELHLDAPIPDQGPEFEEVRKSLLPMSGFVMGRPLEVKASNGS